VLLQLMPIAGGATSGDAATAGRETGTAAGIGTGTATEIGTASATEIAAETEVVTRAETGEETGTETGRGRGTMVTGAALHHHRRRTRRSLSQSCSAQCAGGSRAALGASNHWRYHYIGMRKTFVCVF
jgi:hypothetical protein